MKSNSTNFVIWIGILFTTIAFSQAQAQIWKPAAHTKTQQKEKTFRKTTPNKYELFDLDINNFSALLAKTPSRTLHKSSNVIMEFPTKDGILQKFRVFEASIFEDKLQKRFPNIRSYIAKGIDDPSLTARFSVSKDGVHVMLLSTTDETRYIDPYTKDAKQYISYSRKDLSTDSEDFVCHVKNTNDYKKIDNQIVAQKNANDGTLRTFRLALACTGEYAQYHINQQGISASASEQVKKEAVLSAMNTTMTRVNGIYERDLAVTMVMVNDNDKIIFLNGNTDSYSNNNGGAMLGQNQTVCDNNIGSSNYDIGHVFSTGGGGVAYLNSPCGSSKAGGVTGLGNPIGDPFDVDYVAHEMGHQYGGNHTFNNACGGNRNNSTAMEPGSGSTIMAYAGICNPNVQNNSDDHFHAISIQEMWNNISSGFSTCAKKTSTNNNAPTANAGANYTIPKSTPFVLKGSGNDPDSGNVLTYCWEQMDNEIATMPPSSTSTGGPLFRSNSPTASPDRYMPALSTIIAGQTSSTWEVLPSVARTMNFRLTVRDNAVGGASSASDNTVITVAENAGPFLVTSQGTNVTWTTGSQQTITWDVANTNAAPVNATNVDILLSVDGGNTFSSTILSGTPNDGSQVITVPNIPGTTSARIIVRGSNHIFYDMSDTDFQITGGTNDTQAPTVPTDLTASNITNTSVELSWTASTDNIGVVAYDIYQGNTVVTTVTGTSATISGLTANTSYQFSIKAKDAAGNESEASNTVNMTTTGGEDTEAPTAPTGLTASDITDTSVLLSWNASSDNVGVTGYDIYQGNTVVTTVTGTSATISGLTANTSYQFSIKAKDAAGNESEASNTVNMTTTGGEDTEAPTAPTGLTASDITDTSVLLSWNASSDNIGVTGYDIYQDSTVITTITGTSATISELTPNTSYMFSIKAKDAAGNESEASNTINVTTKGDDITYCAANGNSTSDEYISRVQLGSIDKASEGSSTGYSNFTTESTNVSKGSENTITITPTWTGTQYNEAYGVWIDYNQDGDFQDTGEQVWTQSPTQTTPVIGKFMISNDAKSGATRMRVIMRYNAVPSPCGSFNYGEVEDYTIVISGSGNDTEAPSAPSELTASDITNTSVALSWVASTDNVTVTGYDVYQGTAVIATVTETSATISGLIANTSYQFSVKAKDAAGNESITSNTVSITTLGNDITYCTANSNNASEEYISRVQIGSIDKTSTGSNTGYSDFTTESTNLSKGTPVTITITPTWAGTKYNEAYGVWIDYNRDGDFQDIGEQVWTQSPTQTTSVTGNFTIPDTIENGATRMRIIMRYNVAPSPCGSFNYGEVEDYTIVIDNTGGGTNTDNICAGISEWKYANTYEVGDQVIYFDYLFIRTDTGWKYIGSCGTGNHSTIKSPPVKGSIQIDIYPNPVTEKINVITNTDQKSLYYEIVDLLGKTISKNTFTSIINASNLQQGVYILKIYDGNSSNAIRFLKK